MTHLETFVALAEKNVIMGVKWNENIILLQEMWVWSVCYAMLWAVAHQNPIVNVTDWPYSFWLCWVYDMKYTKQQTSSSPV
jgi:hypothetical protein